MVAKVLAPRDVNALQTVMSAQELRESEVSKKRAAVAEMRMAAKKKRDAKAKEQADKKAAGSRELAERAAVAASSTRAKVERAAQACSRHEPHTAAQ